MLQRVVLLVFGVWMMAPAYKATPLDDYVNKPDPHYNYTVLEWKYRGPDFTLYLINMTSQQWLTDKDVDRSIWWHYIVVAVPDKLTHLDVAFLHISENSNDYKFTKVVARRLLWKRVVTGSVSNAIFTPRPCYTPDISDVTISFAIQIAVSTGTISAILNQIPNQPVVFKNDPSHTRRRGDGAMAWTWKVFTEDHPDRPELLLVLPMTKGIVRAMDTIGKFGKTVKPASRIQKFMVSGHSKRGWVTWLAAAVDKRVVAIAPIVMDMLNMQKSLHHHFQSLGGWTFVFRDYYDLNFTRELDSPNTKLMHNILDPFVYTDRLTMPKYIITAGGDEFFLPDDPKFYISDLKGQTYLRRIPNAEHSLLFHWRSMFRGVQSFFLSVLENHTRPKLRWEKNYTSKGGTLTVYTNIKPLTIRVEHAQTTGHERRDFRLAKADPKNPKGFRPQWVIWIKGEVTMVKDGVYRASFENPRQGWLAFFIEMTFPGPSNVTSFEFCTETMIIPNTYPFPDCHGEQCRGTLV